MGYTSRRPNPHGGTHPAAMQPGNAKKLRIFDVSFDEFEILIPRAAAFRVLITAIRNKSYKDAWDPKSARLF